MTDALDVAIKAARQAGDMLREGWGQTLEIREATHHDIKLQMDVDCERLIRRILLEAYPGYAMLGEECGGEIVPEIPTWVIDPLDGTVNYARQVPHYCTSIALVHEGRERVGVVYDPATDELFTAEEGGGASLNGRRLAVSEVVELAAANVGMGFSKSVRAIAGMLDGINELAHAIRKIRIMGAAALDLAYVAAGRFDAFMEYNLRTWDIAAGALLIREAGGRVQLTPAGVHAWDVRADNGKIWGTD